MVLIFSLGPGLIQQEAAIHPQPGVLQITQSIPHRICNLSVLGLSQGQKVLCVGDEAYECIVCLSAVPYCVYCFLPGHLVLYHIQVQAKKCSCCFRTLYHPVLVQLYQHTEAISYLAGHLVVSLPTVYQLQVLLQTHLLSSYVFVQTDPERTNNFTNCCISKCSFIPWCSDGGKISEHLSAIRLSVWPYHLAWHIHFLSKLSLRHTVRDIKDCFQNHNLHGSEVYRGL